jgi:hypothetical protein
LRSGIEIRRIEFLLDGVAVRPEEAYPATAADAMRDYDRVELYDSGWRALLPLAGTTPPHELQLRALLSNGESIIFATAKLR